MTHQQTLDPQASIQSHFNFLPWRAMSRLPVIMQSEVAECGLACLAMVSSYHGQRIDLADLRHTLGAAQDGVNLKQLMTQASHIGLSCHPVKVELNALKNLQTPCILHWDMNHFVVLRKATRRHVIIHDPAVGLVKMSYRRASELFSGIAIEFEPNEHFVTRTQTKVPTLRSIMGRTKGLGKALSHILALSLLLQLIGLISPALMQWMIDNALTSSDQSLIVTVVAGMALLTIINLVLGTLRSWMEMYLSINLGFKWASRVLTHLLHLPVDYFERRHLGDVLSRFGSVTAIQQTVTNGVISAVLDGLMAILTVVMIWLYSPTLAMTAIVAVILLALLQFVTFDKLKRLGNESMIADARVSSNLMESIRGIRPIKLAGKSNLRKMNWQTLSVESINIGLRQQWLNIGISALSTIITSGQRLIAIYLAAMLIAEGEFSIGMLFAYLAYQDQFIGRAAGLVGIYFQFKMLRLHFERLSDIVLTEPEQLQPLDTGESHDPTQADSNNSYNIVPMAQTQQQVNTEQLSVTFKDVCFKYSALGENVLNNINFDTKGSKCTVLVGRSGIGKTTIMKMILGIYQPSSGQIFINNQPIDTIGVEQLRENVACVLQDDALFQGSIAENISFFDPELDQARIEQCAEIACVHDDITHTIMGYHTMVGDMGSTLSAGQKQRILIARALYRQPQVLLLDEATSDLDVPTEQKLNENLAKLDMHRIYIAHRPQTIKFGDQVVEIQ